MPGTAGPAFRSAVRALGESDTSDALCPKVALPLWEAASETEGAAFIDAADAGGVVYEARINGQGPFRMSLGKSHSEGMWQLETRVELRVPVEPRMELCVTGAAEGGLLQSILRGAYAPPAELAFIGAPGHLVPCDERGGHLFAHVLNIEGRGPTVVHLTVWARIERD
jgi:hypothetical protein